MPQTVLLSSKYQEDNAVLKHHRHVLHSTKTSSLPCNFPAHDLQKLKSLQAVVMCLTVHISL